MIQRLLQRLKRRLVLAGASCGDGVRVEGTPRVVNDGALWIGEGVELHSEVVSVELVVEAGATLRIGSHSVLEGGVSIGCTGRIDLEERVVLGRYVMVIDSDYHDLNDRDRVPEPQPVFIGAGAIIGHHSSVMPGVTIGTGARIWPNSVVTKDVPAFAEVRGVPAKPLQEN